MPVLAEGTLPFPTTGRSGRPSTARGCRSLRGSRSRAWRWHQLRSPCRTAPPRDHSPRQTRGSSRWRRRSVEAPRRRSRRARCRWRSCWHWTAAAPSPPHRRLLPAIPSAEASRATIGLTSSRSRVPSSTSCSVHAAVAARSRLHRSHPLHPHSPNPATTHAAANPAATGSCSASSRVPNSTSSSVTAPIAAYTSLLCRRRFRLRRRLRRPRHPRHPRRHPHHRPARRQRYRQCRRRCRRRCRLRRTCPRPCG